MHTSDPDSERPYRVDEGVDRTIFARRGGEAAWFLMPRLRAGMRLLDCGCGPGSITLDLARAVAPGETIGIDIRDEALEYARTLARDRAVPNVEFRLANVYQLPFDADSFDATFACALLQNLASPLRALEEMRRILRPGGVVGIVDGSSSVTFRYPSNAILDAFDRVRILERAYRMGYSSQALEVRALLRRAGFERTEGFAFMGSESGAPGGNSEQTRRVAENHLLQLRGQRGKLALEHGWATQAELEHMAEALIAWGEHPDAMYARPAFAALGWK